MNNLTADISNVIKTIIANGWSGIIIFVMIIGALCWLYKAGEPVYKEMSLKYHPFFAGILAIMASFVDLIQPNTFKSRTAQDIIIQFGTVIVAIVFFIIIIILVISNWDVVSRILHG